MAPSKAKFTLSNLPGVSTGWQERIKVLATKGKSISLQRYSRIFHVGLVALLLGLGWVFTRWKPAQAEALTIAAVVVGGLPILWGAVSALLSLRLNADVLVSIAILASIYLGEYRAGAIVAFIMLLGEQLEEITLSRTRAAIESLVRLTPQTARVRRGNAVEEVPLEEVRRGDVVVVKSGERIPVDGIVRAGEASVSQAAITGEAMPVEKGAGDEVYSGTLNEVGALEIEVTKVGEETMLARIIRLVEEAQESKAPIQRITDRYAVWFVPAVLLTALLVFLLTSHPARAAAVLVVSCPCALVLATPTAVVAGIGNAARQGILIKGGACLEQAGRLDTIVLDKTGTLTKGETEVCDVKGLDGHNEREVIALAAIAEKLSEHPLAQAILQRARELAVEVPDPERFQAIRGQGVIAWHEGKRIILGSRELVRSQGIALPEGIEGYMQREEGGGKTAVIVAYDGAVWGVISVADAPRAGVSDMLKRLGEVGITKVIMLTGDNPRAALALAEGVGIADVRAEMMPEEKVQVVKRLICEGNSVAVIGDGINDAPALATADIGIAMGATGTDVALETADIVLMTDDLSKIPVTIRLSRRALGIIRQNLVFSLLFNLAMIAAASSGHVSMVTGAILHEIGSLVVVFNSMRLLGRLNTTARATCLYSSTHPSTSSTSFSTLPPARS